MVKAVCSESVVKFVVLEISEAPSGPPPPHPYDHMYDWFVSVWRYGKSLTLEKPNMGVKFIQPASPNPSKEAGKLLSTKPRSCMGIMPVRQA